MSTPSPSRHRDTFEFGDGLRRFALAGGEPAQLEPGRAAALLRARVVGDSQLRRELAAWYRRVWRFAGLGDDQQLIAKLLREVAAGFVRVAELEQPPMRAYAHTYARSELPASEPEPPAENQFEPGLDEPTLADLRVVEYLAVGDFNFSTDRAVMLPGPSSESERAGDLADGVALIAGLLAHLRRTEGERKLIAAGHTDAAGSFAHNLELSEQRALSVKLACDGDTDGFADHAAAHAEVADGQEVLRWIARRFGWSCDPGPIDNDDGPKTSAARSRFRERFTAEFGEPAGSAAAFERPDWRAFFRLYEQDLAARLGVTLGGLPALRERIAWADPAVLGCGEHWPEAKLARSSANHADRRVELLCFSPEDLPGGAGEPPGASVYGAPSYRWIAIRPGPGPHPLGGPCFELTLPAEAFGSDLEGVTLRLRGGPYELSHAVVDAKPRGDSLLFHFHGIAKGPSYTATIERDGCEPIMLFDEASLDSYIAAIGDLERQPEPIPIFVSPSPEPREPGGPYELIEPPDDDEGIYEE